ncbi:hypothetical protein TYRP_019350, partial [Tyrophagus putrescentiae]
YLKLKYNFNTFLINANLFYEPRLNKTTGKWEGVVGYVFSGQAQLGLEYDSPVDTSKDLLNYLSQNKLYMLTVDFFKNAFINAKDPTDIYFKLGQYINQTKPELALPNIFKMSSQIKKHWANFVYIDNKIVLINMVNHFGLNKMHISKENIGIDNMGIALTKNIRQMQEMGIIEKIIQNTNTKKLNYTGILTNIKIESDGNQQQQYISFALKPTDLSSIFIIWAIGLAVSSTNFLLEFALGQFKKSDIGVCSISKAFEREKYVDFTTMTYFDWVSFFTPKPTLKSKNWLVTNNTPIIIQTIKSKWPNFVYIDNNSMLNSIVNYIGSNRVYKSSLHLNPDPLAFALPKRSPLLKYFNLFIQQLHEFGIIEKIRSTTFLKESIAHRKNFDNNLLKFNFQVNLVYAQQTWGHIDLKTGKINGMISQVFQGTSQLGLCHISRALERLYFVDYSHFTYLDPITFLSPMPGIKTQNWIIAKPFHLQTWTGVMLSLFFLSITIYWSYKNIILKYQTSIGYWGKYSVILVKLYAILLGQPTKLHHWKANDAIRLIFVVWLFVSLTINRSYGGVFFAFLTVPEFGNVIDSMAQLMSLVKSDQVTIITNGLYTKRFIHSGPESPVYFDLGLHINRTNPKSFNLYENSVKQLKNLEKLKHPIPVYIQTRILLSSVSYIYGKNKFHVGSENINIDFTGVIMSKRSPLKKTHQ